MSRTRFPEEFCLRMQKMLGDDYDAFMQSYESPFHNGFRLNTLKVDPERFVQDADFASERVPWTTTGYYLDHEKRFYSSHPCYHAGLYYIQEASAMLPARLVKARPGDRILDLCAAPGGKSTAIAADMKNEGLLVSNDLSRSRAKALVHNIEVMGVKNCIVTSAAPDKLASVLPGYFDKIIIDAPCSGEGMFHKEPSMTESWKRNGPEFYHELQKQILESAAGMLAPGGRLVYSTCTFSPQEDEGSIAWFLGHFPQFHVVSVDDLLCGCRSIDHGEPEYLSFTDAADCSGEIVDQMKMTVRLWPHHLAGEGHFAAVLEKDGEKEEMSPGGTAEVSSSRELEPFFRFLKEEGIRLEFDRKRLRVSNGYISYLPVYMPDLSGIHILRNGWYLGELRKGRFEPSGAFARGLRAGEAEKRISLEKDGEAIRRYLKCESLPIEEGTQPGWNLVCMESRYFDSAAVGWCKVSGSKFKNKYPAGWRIQ